MYNEIITVKSNTFLVILIQKVIQKNVKCEYHKRNKLFFLKNIFKTKNLIKYQKSTITYTSNNLKMIK